MSAPPRPATLLDDGLRARRSRLVLVIAQLRRIQRDGVGTRQPPGLGLAIAEAEAELRAIDERLDGWRVGGPTGPARRRVEAG